MSEMLQILQTPLGVALNTSSFSPADFFFYNYVFMAEVHFKVVSK